MISMSGNVGNGSCKENNVTEKEWKRKGRGRHRVHPQWCTTRTMRHQIPVKKLNRMTHL